MLKIIRNLYSHKTRSFSTSKKTMVLHALQNFDKLIELTTNKECVVFLDYDGTLSPIVPIPDDAIISDECRDAVRKIAYTCKTAIVSGRKREDVTNRVRVENLYYAGSHGFDIASPDGTTYQAAKEFVPVLQEFFKTLQESFLKDIGGCFLENNIYSLSVHYRCVDKEEDVKRIFDFVQKEAANPKWQNKIRLTYGKKVIECRLNYDWNKGKAVEYLLQCMKLDDPNKVFAIYIGDDTTDEDAFDVLKTKKFGVGILVATEKDKLKNTSAEFYLNDTNEVPEFLSKYSEVTQQK